MTLQIPEEERSQSIKWLAATVLITVFVWNTPWAFVLYPFVMLATWFHEMGHGLAAAMVGARFQELVLLPDGSGYTNTLRPLDMSPAAMAFISAGGPLGPAIAGGALIVSSRWTEASRWALYALAGVIIVSTLIWVSGLTGWVVLPLLAAGIIVIGRYGQLRQRQFALQFLGLQACISTFINLGYLFSRGGVMEGRLQASDTEQMAQALLLPYWVWGGLLTLTIAGIIVASLRVAYRR